MPGKNQINIRLLTFKKVQRQSLFNSTLKECRRTYDSVNSVYVV